MRFALSVLLTAAAAAAGAQENLTLAAGGETPYVIVYAEAGPPVLETAARDLADHLEEMTGAAFPVQTDAQPLPAKAILLGQVRQVEFAGAWENLGPDGYCIRTAGDYLLIYGGEPRGAAYGVYGFLGDHLGCRWFTPDTSYVPAYETLVVRPINDTVVPPLIYRESFWIEARDPMWNLRNRLNPGWIVRLEEQYGGSFVYRGVHTFFHFCPPDPYFSEHPEYFSLIEGERRADGAQLCLTNPDVLELAITWAKAQLAGDPERKVVSVSQNDWHGACQCADCQAIARREGSEAGPVIWFVNRVAEAIEQDFPDRYVGTLAYQYTRKPPKNLVPRENVAIRLCSIECSFSEPLEGSEFAANRQFVEDLKGWQKKTDNLFIWNYTTNFAHFQLPMPNLRTIGPNLRTFVKYGVRGVFEQGNYKGEGGGELASLRNYLLARFLWDPESDLDAGLEAYLDARYGPAAPKVRRFIEYMHDRAEGMNAHIGCFASPERAYYQEPFAQEARALLVEADELALGKPEIQARIAKLMMPVDYVVMANAAPEYEIENDRYRETPPAEAKQAAQRFFATAERQNISHAAERLAMAEFQERYENRPSYPVTTLANEHLRAVLVPHLGGRIAGLFLPGSDRNLLPGGHAVVVTAGSFALDTREPFVCAASDTQATLTRSLPGLGTLVRQVKLQPGRPAVTLTLAGVNGSTGVIPVQAEVSATFAEGAEMTPKASRTWQGAPLTEGPGIPSRVVRLTWRDERPAMVYATESTYLGQSKPGVKGKPTVWHKTLPIHLQPGETFEMLETIEARP